MTPLYAVMCGGVGYAVFPTHAEALAWIRWFGPQHGGLSRLPLFQIVRI